MKKLTKKYKIIYNDTKMIFPLTENGYEADVFVPVALNTKEFDSFEEAKMFVGDNKLTYDEPEIVIPEW